MVMRKPYNNALRFDLIVIDNIDVTVTRHCLLTLSLVYAKILITCL